MIRKSGTQFNTNKQTKRLRQRKLKVVREGQRRMHMNESIEELEIKLEFEYFRQQRGSLQRSWS